MSDMDQVDQPIPMPTIDPNMEVELVKASVGTVYHPKISIETENNKLPAEPEGQLTIDVFQTASEIVIESAIAGVGPEDIDINVTSDSVTIRGERHRESKVRDEDYLYQECYWGRFSRSVILPQEVDSEAAEATFKNGILSVHLPKIIKQKTRKLKVKLG
ncbi:MAG: Hsp20/alpha crystallin family protein [Candidatus Liptonbacteria bacterium]|nr:Hsp20/alpha crystallin family protein [Candidatus Liptonbacteria bacterium]